MENFFLFLLLFVSFPPEVTASTEWTVKGKVTCKYANGDIKPLANQEVELWEWDPLPKWVDSNDRLGNEFANSKGFYEVSGKETELGKLDPYLSVVHTCGGIKFRLDMKDCFKYETRIYFDSKPTKRTIDVELGKEIIAKSSEKPNKLKVENTETKIKCDEAVYLDNRRLYHYNDALTRQKFWPLAAAAYGGEEQMNSCMRKHWDLERDDPSIIELVKFYKLNASVLWPLFPNKDFESALHILVSHVDKAIIMTFRGVGNFSTITHLLLASVKTKNEAATEGSVHRDIDRLWNAFFKLPIFDEIKELIKTFVEEEEEEFKYDIWLTGHSIGGSLAVLTASALVNRLQFPAERIKLVTFGEPRTGDEEWAKRLDVDLPFYTYRVIHRYDVVPLFPRRDIPPILIPFLKLTALHLQMAADITNLFDYSHYKYEVWYDKDMAPNDPFEICLSSDKDTCIDNMEFWVKLSFFYRHLTRRKLIEYIMDEHQKYFGLPKRASEYGQAGCK